MAAAAHLQLAAGGTPFPGGTSTSATISPANAAAAMAAASAVTAEAAHGSHKRARMDLSQPHPTTSNTAGASSGSTTSNAISHPLTIDTREAVKVRNYIRPASKMAIINSADCLPWTLHIRKSQQSTYYSVDSADDIKNRCLWVSGISH